MNEITVKVHKENLLAKLKENREQHGAAFAKAWEGYTMLARQELENLLEAIKNNKPISRYLNNIPPDDHTGDYDEVIEMLGMCVDDEIELTQGQFRQYVKDDWGWKQAWTASNAGYVEAASAR